MNKLARQLLKLAQSVNELSRELSDLQASNRVLERKKEQLEKTLMDAKVSIDLAHLNDQSAIDSMQGKSKTVLDSLLKKLEQLSDFQIVFTDKAQLKQMAGSLIPFMQKDLSKLDDQFFNYKTSGYNEDMYNKNIQVEKSKNQTLQDEIDRLAQEVENQKSPLSQTREQASNRQSELKEIVRPIVSKVQEFLSGFETFIDDNTLTDKINNLVKDINKTKQAIEAFQTFQK